MARANKSIFLKIFAVWLSLFGFIEFAQAAIFNNKIATEALIYAKLADDVYETYGNSNYKNVKDGYQRLPSPCDSEYNGLFGIIYEFEPCTKDQNGFYAAFYKSTHNNKHVIAYRGTKNTNGIPDLIRDIITDLKQILLGKDSSYAMKHYNAAKKFAENIKSDKGSNIILVGHSLGGGLASYAALKLNLEAYIFNTARLNKNMYNNYEDNGKIKSFYSYISINSYLDSTLNIFINSLKGNISPIQQLHMLSLGGKYDPVSIWGYPTPKSIEYRVDFPTNLGKKSLDERHSILELIEVIQIYANGYSPQQIIASQDIYASSPGGNTIKQTVIGLTPNTNATLYVKLNETGYKYTVNIKANSQGVWSDNYKPSTTKEYGTYVWYVKDNTTGKLSNEDFYYILDPSSPDPLYGNQGYEIANNTPSSKCLPDYVAKRTWITKSKKGADKYVFEVGDKAWVHTKIKNEGCKNSPQDIKVMFLLSKGEKEDSHSTWQQIGDLQNIRDYNLKKGKDKTERIEFTVPNKPGKYNIVACADRTKTKGNGDGEVIEEHKSNNCSTEAVFTVLPKSYPPTGNVDTQSCQVISGWADDQNSAGSILVEIYKNGSYFDSITTDKNTKRFDYIVPDVLKDGTNQQLSFYAQDYLGDDNKLIGTVNLTCSDNTEKNALISIYNSTNGTNWTKNDNWLSGDPCTNDWYGINCTNKKITSLNLNKNQLNGILPIKIGDLTNLTFLDLSNNQISGKIPVEISNLSKLTELSLCYNQLSGSIPTEIGKLSNLTSLELHNNQLSGKIPVEISNLSKLTRLTLGWNQLSGGIPFEIGNLTNLTVLDLSNTQTIDISMLKNMTNLFTLYLYDNQISDISVLKNMTNLNFLGLSVNKISDISPLQNLTKLVYLSLGANKISDINVLKNLTNLTHLYLYNNQISDIAALQNLTNIVKLYIQNNYINNFAPIKNLSDDIVFGKKDQKTLLYIVNKQDFNKDSIDDIFWRDNNTGQNHIWYLNADGSHKWMPKVNKPVGYAVAGRGDFNGDGISDILWRNGEEVAFWYMDINGTHKWIRQVDKPISFKVAGIGDFNGDGCDDIFWRDSISGKNHIWYMYKDKSRIWKPKVSKPTGFEVVGIGDFNGDGRDDIFWRNGIQNSIWYMNANNTHTWKLKVNKPLDFKVAGIGDFNGDGRDDIFWRNGAKNSIWYMNENNSHRWMPKVDKPIEYKVVGIGDFNGDGLDDIFWRKESYNYIWYMKSNGSHLYRQIKYKPVEFVPYL